MNITKVKKVNLHEAMEFLRPVIRELGILAIPFEVDEEKGEIRIKIPKFIPVDKYAR